MKRIGVVLLVLALAAPVLAGGIDVASSAPHRVGVPASGADRSVVVYSNVTNFSPYGSGTSNSVTGVYNEVGDDLALTQAGTLDTLKFSVWNSDFTAFNNLLTADLEVKFYNYSIDPNGVFQVGSLIGGFTDPGQTLNLLPGYATVLNFTGLNALSINLPTNIIASLKITNMTGGSKSAGQLIMAGGADIGSTYPYFFKNGTYYWWFGGNPPGNWAWEVGIVPEPAAMLLLGLAGLLIRRR